MEKRRGRQFSPLPSFLGAISTKPNPKNPDKLNSRSQPKIFFSFEGIQPKISEHQKLLKLNSQSKYAYKTLKIPPKNNLTSGIEPLFFTVNRRNGTSNTSKNPHQTNLHARTARTRKNKLYHLVDWCQRKRFLTQPTSTRTAARTAASSPSPSLLLLPEPQKKRFFFLFQCFSWDPLLQLLLLPGKSTKLSRAGAGTKFPRWKKARSSGLPMLFLPALLDVYPVQNTEISFLFSPKGIHICYGTFSW